MVWVSFFNTSEKCKTDIPLEQFCLPRQTMWEVWHTNMLVINSGAFLTQLAANSHPLSKNRPMCIFCWKSKPPFGWVSISVIFQPLECMQCPPAKLWNSALSFNMWTLSFRNKNQGQQGESQKVLCPKHKHLKAIKKRACASRSLFSVLISASIVTNLVATLQVLPCYSAHELPFLPTQRPSSVAEMVLLPVS